MDKITIESLSLRDLMDYETASKQIVAEYANLARKYDGSFGGSDDELKMIEKYSKLHDKLKFELMRRLDMLQ